MIEPTIPAIPAEQNTKEYWDSLHEAVLADDSAYMLSSPGPMTPEERAVHEASAEANQRHHRMSDAEITAMNRDHFRVTQEMLDAQQESDDAIIAAGGSPWDF